MRFATPEQIRDALHAHRRRDWPDFPGRANDRLAAVLVPIAWRPEPTVLLTLRTSHLREHAGEVSFPGGKVDELDPSLEHTAIRETDEELGLEAGRIELLGRLSSMPIYTSEYRLVPFVAAVDFKALRPSPLEVAKVLELRLSQIFALDAISAIPFTWEGTEHLSPVFDVDGHWVYGVTAHALFELIELVAPLCGVQLPPLIARSGLEKQTWGKARE